MITHHEAADTDTGSAVSVIIAVYNGERYLAEAIESVLNQTRSVLEVIVVDDGSTDRSAAVAAGYGSAVRCFTRPHEGVSAALNFGVAQARGNLFAFLDADDLWHEDKIARQAAALRRPDAPDIVFAHAQPFVSPDVAASGESVSAAQDAAAPGYLKGTMLLSRSTFARVGSFDTTRQLGDFIDWFLRAREAGLRSEMLPDVLLHRRIHGDNTGIREKHLQSDYVKILKASLDRRRATGAPDA
ncbi:MAG: glycosyltransferase [Armatimonadota bacterium]